MHRTAVVALLVSLFSSACSGLLRLDDPDLSISVSSEVPLPSRSILRVVVGARRYDLDLGSDPGARNSIEARAPRTGELGVQVLLLDSAGTARAETSFAQRFEADHDHWVAARVGEHRPLGHCIGSLIALPIRPSLATSRADSVFIMYGSISKGAIC